MLVSTCRSCVQTAPTAASRTGTKVLAVALPGLSSPVHALEVAEPDELLDEGPLADDECDVYGACLWPSSYVLARALVDMLQGSREAHVVELGCGAAALPSLTALAVGARVVATDWSPLALELAYDSACRYQPSRADAMQTVRFDVRDAERSGFSLPWPCTHLVCADMLYDERAAHAVGMCVAHAVSQGATAIVGDPGRMNGAGREHFVRGLRSVAGDASWMPDRVEFIDEAITQAELHGFGASLSWCGDQETSVGVLRLEPPAADQSLVAR